MLYCAGSVLSGFAVFVAVNSFFAVLDLTGRPACLLRYKIQEEKTVPVSFFTETMLPYFFSLSCCLSFSMVCSLSLSPSLSQVNWQMYKKTLNRVLFNALVTSAIFQLTTYPLAVWRGMPCGYELPSFPVVLWDLFLCLVVVEICFYYSHRCIVLCWWMTVQS